VSADAADLISTKLFICENLRNLRMLFPLLSRDWICICASGRHPRFRMPEEQQPESTSPAPPKGLAPRRRGRRGGRGRRRPAPAVSTGGQLPQTESPGKQIEPPIRLREGMPERPAPSRPKFQPDADAPIEPPREKFQPAPRRNDPDNSAISRAVNEVTDIVESLRQALEQMEEVLELVEHAERQKTADEREIESLLRALRQFQSRGERPERPQRPERREPQNRPPRPARQPEPQRTEPPDRPEPPPVD